MWTNVNHWKIYYEVQGEGEPVLLLHGIPTSSFIWRRQSEALSGHFRVYALDLLGFGNSEKAADFDYTISSYAELVDGFLTQVGVQRVILGVHDLGGAVGLAFLGRYPEKVSKLIVLDTFAYLPPAKRLPWVVLYGFLYKIPWLGDLFDRLLWEIGVKLTDGFVSIAFRNKKLVTRELVEKYRELNRETRATDYKVLLANGIDGITGAVEQNSFKVKVPTLVLWAENDLLFPPSAAEHLHRNIAGSILKTIPECGHFLQEEKPDEVNRHILEFLTQPQLSVSNSQSTPNRIPNTQITKNSRTVEHGEHVEALRRGLGLLLLVEGVITALWGRRFMAWQLRIAPRWYKPALVLPLGMPEPLLRLTAVLEAVAGVWLWQEDASRQEVQEVVVVIHIDAPPETVWASMADLPFLRALPFTTMEVIGKPVNVGTVYRWTFTLPLGLTFRFDEEVTEWVPTERIAYRAISGWEMEAGPVLTPERGGTRFHFTLHYRFPGLWRVTPRWLIELGCRQGLANLRKMIEMKSKG